MNTPKYVARGLAVLAILVGQGTPVTARNVPAAVVAAPPGPDAWTLVLDEEFSGTTLNRALWSTCTGNVLGLGCAGGGGEISLHLPDDVQVDNGTLRLKGQRRNVTDAYNTAHAYTAGAISSREGFSFQYGYFEARMKVPTGRGMWSGLFTLPIDPRSTSPEIDAVEILGNNSKLAYLTQHYETMPGQGGQSQGEYSEAADFALGWHTFGVDWKPDALIWYIDGVERFRSTANLPAEPMYLIASLAVGAAWNGNEQPDANTLFPNALEIDYIKVWQRGDNGRWQRGEPLLRNQALDDLASFDGVFARSTNLRVTNDAPLDYLRDHSRVIRTTNTPETLTWRFPNMGSAELRAMFSYNEPVKQFRFFVSPDNVTYNQITPQELWFFGSVGPWIDYRLRNLPAGTQYMRAEFPAGMTALTAAQVAYASFEPAFTLNDDLANLMQTAASSGVNLITGQAASYGGDNTRLVRNGASGSVTWRQDNVTQLRSTAWFPPAQAVEHFRFWVSRDGVSFNLANPTITQIGGTWRRIDYLLNPPPCTNYIKIEFPGGATSPQLGAQQMIAATPSKLDDFHWFGGAHDVSLGVRLQDDAPANFDGDVSRFARLGTNSEYAQWRMPNVRQVRAYGFADPGQPILDPRFYASADNQSFQPIAATRVITPGAWTRVSYSANVPPCMEYVRVELPAGGVNGAVTQLTRVDYSAVPGDSVPPTPTPTPVPGAVTLNIAVLDSAFAPLQGWDVTAENSTTGAVSTQRTGANGVAAFAVPAGSYKICEALQPGWTNLYPGNTCYWLTLAAHTSTSLSFRNQGGAAATQTPVPQPTATPAPGGATATITVQDVAYLPLVGVNVSTRNLSTGATQSAPTLANGTATFSLTPGPYTFCETLDSGWSNLYPGNSCYWITVNAGDAVQLAFRNQRLAGPTATPLPTATPPIAPTATPAGQGAPITIFVLAENYAPLAGWDVTMRNSSTGDSVVQTTGSNGGTTFAAPAGNYTFCETLKPGFTNVSPGNTCYWITVRAGDTFGLTFRNR